MGTLKIDSILRSNGRQYRIEKILGQGSFGITYLASTTIKVEGPLGNIETPIKVAIKEFFMRDINGRDEGTVTCSNQSGLYNKYKEKFIKEAQNLSKLKHRHIINVLDVFEANNTYYYVMEFCDGGSLDDKIKRQGTLGEGDTIRYTLQITEALNYMHANKMLHLDLKPGNVMLRNDGNVVLIDFGLSKQYDDNGYPESSTSIGGGTPGYAPIEQTNYNGSGFPKTMDIYAIGATMFKMLTGKRPPEASMILNQGFPAYELQSKNVSEGTTRCIAKAMHPSYKGRIQSIEEFLKLLNGEGVKTQSDNEARQYKDEETDIIEVEEAKTPNSFITDFNRFYNTKRYEAAFHLSLSALYEYGNSSDIIEKAKIAKGKLSKTIIFPSSFNIGGYDYIIDLLSQHYSRMKINGRGDELNVNFWTRILRSNRNSISFRCGNYALALSILFCLYPGTWPIAIFLIIKCIKSRRKIVNIVSEALIETALLKKLA